MAQDVFSKMAEEPWLLNEDGYLNADTDIKEIIYHPTLNVILICTKSGIVRVLDVNSGVVLQSSQLSALNSNEVTCRYIAGQDRILFTDGQAIGVRSDYNGVLLLDSILQKVITDSKEEVKVELPLSEAVILKESLLLPNISLKLSGNKVSDCDSVDHIINELTDVISNAQKQSKKGIKAQKWNTVCLKLPLNDLKMATSNSVTDLLAKHHRTPELAVASAVQERVSELLGETANASDRRAMASESKRRDTFSQWPHMDYKWALPEQMAQAGFYHQPNSSGDDRAMCFTCNVCLVCWERTDEPWSEHERHSQNCPFVMGEYTQNIPLSVTYATCPAVDATYRGVNVQVLGSSTVGHLMPTSNEEGLISVFDIGGKVKRTHSFFVSQFDSHILEKITQEFGILGVWSDTDDGKYPTEKTITALSVVSEKTASSSQEIRPTVVCGLTIKAKTKNAFSIDALNDKNKKESSTSSASIMDVNYPDKTSCIFLVVYDFMYSKDQENKDLVKDDSAGECTEEKLIKLESVEEDEAKDGAYIHFPNGIVGSWAYKTLIPEEGDEMFFPPLQNSNTSPKTYSGPRSIDPDTTETDSSSPNFIINFHNGPSTENGPKSISDHINELKSNKTNKKLNYSRAVQCLALPDAYKNRKDLQVSSILTTQDGWHVLVVLKSVEHLSSVLIVYALDFSAKMVKLCPDYVTVRELGDNESPVEVGILPPVDKLDLGGEVEGNAVLVCADGAVRIVQMSTLRTICYAKLESEKFVSAAYCNSLERLCASTEKGSLHFYALNDTDNESLEDHDEEDMFTLNLDNPSTNQTTDPTLDNCETTKYFHEPPDIIPESDLKRLYNLTLFEPLKAGYCAVVPPCWSEIQQAQRQRRHPQSLNVDCEQYTKTWRLQTDLTTWDEHMFEITLPTPMSLGHVDVHFTLQPSTLTPHVEVTLLRQNTSGIGHKRDVKFSVDESVTIDMLQWADNPVITQEYLRAHNADILAGPINIATCLDLSEQSGVVTLTSPKLFKSRNRTLLLHLRVVYSKEEENNRANVKGKRTDASKSATLNMLDKFALNNRKTEYFMGCDCIHELSVTVYTSKHTEIAGEKLQRTLMLESNAFVQSLLLTAATPNTDEVQGLVLDILSWVASIRLTRNRSYVGEPPTQQIEFLHLIQENLHSLLYGCLIDGVRQITHKCAKIFVTCHSGAKNFNEQIGTSFEGNLLNTLVLLLEHLSSIKSAAGLQWLMNLMINLATDKEQSYLVSTKCAELLSDVSNELTKRINPYHLVLRTRYGLYGTPMDPELFDVDPPPYPKGSSLSLTYASVVAAEPPVTNSNFYANYSFYKENLNPKEVLSASETKIKGKHIAPPRVVKGLIETEPLHFICVGASEGTRLEKAGEGGITLPTSAIINNHVVNTMSNNEPVTYITNSGAGGSSNVVGHKNKDKLEHFWNNVVEIVTKVKKSGSNSSEFSDKLHAFPIKNLAKFNIPETFQLKKGAKPDTANIWSSDMDILLSPEKPQIHQNAWGSSEDFLSPSEAAAPNLWQHLFVPPTQQVIVVERMHSGARRYVTVDFGQPVLLTDVMIPYCADLVSISIDIWLKGEDLDPVRLVVSSDINSKNLILNDLQPSPLCRFMKITTVGRYGMSTTRCRIPVGYFYGHIALISEEATNNNVQEPSSSTSATSLSENDKQLATLTKLLEDIGCKYSLSCSKLKESLESYIESDIKNSAHLSVYMNIMKDKHSSISSEHSKIFQAYREAITYQKQLNTIRNIILRIERASTNKKTKKQAPSTFTNISTDKLRIIAESLLEVLLSIDSTSNIDAENCQKLFQGLCVSQSPRLQFLAAMFLKNACGTKNFWGNFLADTLAEMFSTSYNSIFPQDRVFITIAYLSRKSFQRSSIIDATLRVIYEALQPLNDSTSLLAVSVDLPHLSWLLMFLSLQLDMNKSAQDSVARWDWVFGEMIGKANVENAKPRLTKKTYKGDLKMGSGYDKIMPVMKCPPDMFMKKAIYCNVPLKFHKNEANTTKKATIKDKEPPNEPSGSEKSSPKKIPLFVGLKHCLIVAKSLINLVLKMDHSSSADMLLLSFKVIARLCILVKLRLGELMSEEQLLQLVNFCLASKIPWAPHALTCLLEDIINVSMKPNKQSPEMETETSASTSWANTNDIDEAIALEENLIINSFPQLAKGQKNTQLPSVYESDDSDLEELMEEFLDKDNVTKKTTPTNKLVSNSNPPNSNAIDSRLDMGVETSSEIFLRKLITSNTSTLVTNITCLGPNNEREESLLPWPTSITINLQPESKSNNNKMLTQCFESLFQNLQIQSPSSVEHILQLYFTLNSQFTTITMPSIYPQIVLSSQSVDMLISTLTWMPGLSLVTWTIALQTLTMVCNTTISQSQWNDISGMAATIVNHRDFINCLMRLLSGNGIAYSEKGLAGPTVCKSLHDLLVRLQMRCDIVSPTSKLGGHFKTLLLKLVYQLVQPHGPVVGRQGPLDVQCKVLQSMLHIDFGNADLGMAISIFESTGNLVHSYVTHVDRIKCNSTSELTNATFRSLYTTVLGADPNKQDRPVSHEVLLIALLKLLKKLIKTPFPNENHEQEAMDIEPTTSQTDESKVEQIQNSSTISPPPQVPCLADVILQHHPSIIRLCNSLAGCKSSSLCMLACISQKFSFVSNFSEPNTISDAVFHVLITLVKTVTNKEVLMQPLMMFLGQIPQLSEPLLWFILQVLDTEEAIRGFYNAGGITILGKNFVNSSSTPSTISKTGTISTVMQYFNKSNRPESNTASTSKKSTMDEQLENRLSLVNFAPCSTIKCTSGTAQPAEVLIQGTTTTHRRARTPQWSYHFYPEEVYTELILQLPSATLLKQIHLQPHSMTLNTCPSAVGVEISSGGPSRLVPIGPPIATSGMSYIQLDLPVAEVVNCVLIRLYKPRTANNISLSQIRLLGFGAFNSKATTSSFLLDDELHCKHSLGWLRIMHHCFTLPLNTEFKNEVVSCTAQVPNLLTTACGLLIVPSHIIPDYLPCLEKVLREISLHNLDTGVATMKILLDSKCGSVELSENTWQEKLLFSNNGYQSSCELLYQICEHQDVNTKFRINLLVEWLKTLSLQAVETDSIQHCKPAYISSAASIIWFAHQSNVAYDLKGMITDELFDAVYALKTHKLTNTPLKRSLDSLLCSTCYIRPELYQVLLQRMGILVPNTSTDLAASISDDRKDKSMTDDNKQLTQAEWYENFVLNDLSSLTLNWAELETLALVSRSPTAIQQLLDSGLTKKLNNVILEFCQSSQNCVVDVLKLEGVTKILKFFTDVCEEKHMQTWLGSSDGSSFWLPLLHWLCKKPVKFSFHCETHAYLEDNVIKFLAKCCLCHPSNQTRLAKVLCDVIALQTDGITGFMRRLILQLLLENEKIPVSVLADETLYKNVKMSPTYIHTHPAFKQTYKRALLCLSTNTTLSEILYQHIYFNPHTLENPGISKKQSFIQKNDLLTSLFAEDSEMSVAAGVLAKDKRAKDNKTQVSTPVKKKRYTADQGVSNDSVGGRYIKCEAYGEQYLPLQLTLGQLLKMLEAKESNSDWPCIHLTVYQKIGSEERPTSEVVIPVAEQQSYSSALQVFSSMGGLALLAQHLPTVYPETVRPSSSEEKVTNSEPSDLDWVKVEDCDDYFNFDDDANGSSSPSKTNGLVSNVPPHSLTAFGLFLRLPGYAEILLKDMKEALCLLRLVLGVTDDGEGGDIFQSSVANTLPTLPFEVLGKLYDSTLLSTDDGRLLRRISITSGVVHLLLACLGIFTHQTTQAEKDAKDSKSKEEKSQLYWAKGTGFGTGSTQQSWNVEQALLKQRSEEEHVTVFLQVLASYVNPNGQASDELADDVLPSSFHDLLATSSLLPALSSYLRNDSVLDMARHIPLYRAALLLLRALAVSSQLVDLLLPQKNRINEPSICSLLKNMKNCVDTYASKLRINTKSKSKFEVLFEDLEQGEGLATLMPDIQDTATLVANVTNSLLDSDGEGDFCNSLERPLVTSLEETYLKFMKTLQFSSYEMISDLPEGGLKFEISHHFESNAKTTPEQSHPSRVKRIAQEAVTLSTSLPLSYSSCVFVRYDTSRLDVMKVLITGPSDTPYANGCFELDVFFPQDYPTSPMLINLETTGHHTVRFNPNLYNDGKVCLSVLNTWHGRPEEKWNAQTSSFLQVLVSIQSLILVPEPYFNEPGYERSRGTPAGTQSSKEYNTTICQATVRWAMLEQVLNPCPCFKDVIHAHFYLKRQEIIDQVDSWVRDMECDTSEKRPTRTNKRTTVNTLDNFKKVVQQLKDSLMKLTPPPSLEDTPTHSPDDVNQECILENDVEMEKMVNEMCE